MKTECSAGGIVFKKENNKIFILVSQHSKHHGWVFPKGRIGDKIENESKQNSAIREVKEETGVLGKITKALKPINYWYEWDGGKIKKTVYYFLMQFLSGDISKHDLEMEKVEWLIKEKVLDRLTYETDKKSWQEAEKLI